MQARRFDHWSSDIPGLYCSRRKVSSNPHDPSCDVGSKNASLVLKGAVCQLTASQLDSHPGRSTEVEQDPELPGKARMKSRPGIKLWMHGWHVSVLRYEFLVRRFAVSVTELPDSQSGPVSGVAL